MERLFLNVQELIDRMLLDTLLLMHALDLEPGSSRWYFIQNVTGFFMFLDTDRLERVKELQKLLV